MFEERADCSEWHSDRRRIGRFPMRLPSAACSGRCLRQIGFLRTVLP